ncbi:MAG: hypothetical protein IT384_34740 [Deltaproteobacteria bacterium]|nr:hypothetical protein [Deltaproteobacteria bacterium]
MSALALTLWIALGATTEAAPAKGLPLDPRAVAEPGWTLDPGPLPVGLVALAVGPEGRGGRPALAFAVLGEDAIPDFGAVNTEARLLEAVRTASQSAQLEAVEVRLEAVEGAEGAVTEIAGTVQARDGPPRRVRFFVVRGGPPLLLTLVAPKSSEEALSRALRRRLVAALGPSTKRR